MPVFKNLAGQKINYLRILYPFASVQGSWQWVTVCDCGTVKIIFGTYITTNVTKSCGCWRQEYARNLKWKHGQRQQSKNSKAYWTYLGIKKRCGNPNEPRYVDYGAKGIRCEFQSFEEFYAEVGDHPGPGYSIDRYPDNQGHYAPGNVRWATAREQSNNRRNNIPIPHNGKTQTIAQWAREIGRNARTLEWRYHAGWSYERMLNEPARHKRLIDK